MGKKNTVDVELTYLLLIFCNNRIIIFERIEVPIIPTNENYNNYSRFLFFIK